MSQIYFLYAMMDHGPLEGVSGKWRGMNDMMMVNMTEILGHNFSFTNINSRVVMLSNERKKYVRVCSNANPLHYYALWVPHKVDRWC